MGIRPGKAHAAALLSLFLLHGCAHPRPASNTEEPASLTVRLPGSEPLDLDLRTQPPNVEPELPPSDAGEKKGRWLRVIEIERPPGASAPPVERTPPGEEGR